MAVSVTPLKKSRSEPVNLTVTEHSEAVVQRCFLKKGYLEISQNSRENTSVYFNKVAGLKPATFRCFLVNCVKFLRTPFLTGHLWWLLLNVDERSLTSVVLSEI